jgi:hypothetical protein
MRIYKIKSIYQKQSRYYHFPIPYSARARPRTPAAPARLIATPVGAAPPSAVDDPAATEAEPEAEPEADPEEEASDPVGEAELDVVVVTVVEAVEEPAVEEPVAVAVA